MLSRCPRKDRYEAKASNYKLLYEQIQFLSLEVIFTCQIGKLCMGLSFLISSGYERRSSR